ncbi:carbohydrate ABC transporter permease [Paenibacillus sp. N4]|uniref:carbohydrate ABC transporter permease n=1 Tax=Paenibacillus vietnamensis TaxID=2590547 RepID=UPI001CD0F2C8|nr:carbohydrate ABC transporter permease [Paenibacillus vietnamensis]MCA0755927.1 carbohydrate ABC transporter permease [Paenibacillus vietnamensis]
MVKDTSFGSRILDFIVHAVMVFVVLITLLPLLHVVSISFSNPDEIMRGRVGLWPADFNLDAYFTILFENAHIPRSFLNSVIITVIGTVLNVLFTTITAYSLSKRDLLFRPFFLMLSVLPMFFTGGIVPQFLLIKSLGMMDSVWALTVPVLISSWWLIIMISFFKNFPQELEEAAKLDGCGELQTLIRIVLPLSMAGVVTIALFYGVSHWNSYFSAMLYMRSYDNYPLQLILREIVLQSTMAEQLASQGNAALAEDMSTKLTPESVQYATLVVSIVPMLVIYPFIQKYFVKGIMIGSLKG